MSPLTRTWLPLALATGLALAEPAREPAPAQEPGAPAEPAGPDRRGPAADGDASPRDGVGLVWRERLLDTDLARREQSFERLIEAVRRSPSLAGLLREWAGDRHRPELAWTARLALRELARPPSFGFHAHVLPTLPDLQAGLRGEAEPRGPAELAGLLALEELRRALGPDASVVRVEWGARDPRAAHGEGAEGGDPAAAATPPPDPVWSEPWDPGPPLRTDVLGVVVRQPTAAELRRFGLAAGGLTVERVVEDTIAQALGLQAGTLLLEINGRTLAVTDHIPEALARRPERGELRVTVVDATGRRSPLTWRPAPARPVPAAPPGTSGTAPPGGSPAERAPGAGDPP